MITIIDYQAGNILSIRNMLKKIGVPSEIAQTTEEINQADKLILPGVGHFDHGMKHLNESGLSNAIKNRVLEYKVPFLGICLGAQLMGKSSEEGNEPGLNLVDMDIIKFDTGKMSNNLKIPHMGWDEVEINQAGSALFNVMYDEPRFYFVHTYHFKMNDPHDVLNTSNYGYSFTSAFQKDNLFGVQYHPEKSHKFGMKLLENFARL